MKARHVWDGVKVGSLACVVLVALPFAIAGMLLLGIGDWLGRAPRPSPPIPPTRNPWPPVRGRGA